MAKGKGPGTAVPKAGGGALVRWGLVALAGLCVVTVLYYVVFPARTVFQADCSDTLYWAMASWDAGALFSKEFYYATLQPFGGLLLMLPFIPLWGFSLKTHIAGMVVFALVFAAALWFFCSSLRLSTRQKLVLFSAVMLLLCGSPKLRELFWEHVIYYSLGALFMLLLLGLVFRLDAARRAADDKARKRGVALWGGLLCLLCFLVGTDGMQVLLFCTVPVAGALVAERFFDVRRPLKSRRNITSGLTVAAMGVFTAGGLLAVHLASRGMRTDWYTDQHMVFSAVTSWADNLLKIPYYWATLVGFGATDGEEILTVAGAAELLRLGVAVLLFVLPICAALQYKSIRQRQLRVLLWTHGILLGILLLSHVVGNTAGAYWRFTPAVFTAMVVSVLYLLWVFGRKTWRRVASLLLGVLALACALNVFTVFTMPTQGGQNQRVYTLVATLEENGLSYGYADFQISQPVTVLSDNEVKTRYVYMDDAGISMLPYQTEPRWYDDVPGQDRYFLVMTQDEYETYSQAAGWQPLWQAVREEITSGPYRILVFLENPMNIGTDKGA